MEQAQQYPEPSAPEGAAEWSAEQLTAANRWTPALKIRERGANQRWFPMPVSLAELRERWGPGIYRLRFRSQGRHPLPDGEPFTVPPGGDDEPKRAPQPATGAPPQADLSALVDLVADAIERRRSAAENPHDLDPAARTFLAVEERSHLRGHEYMQHHVALAQEDTKRFAALLSKLDEERERTEARIAAERTSHQDQVGQLLQAVSAEKDAWRTELEQTKEELMAQLEASEPPPQQETAIGQLVHLLGGPEAVAGIIQQGIALIAQRASGELPPGALPSPGGGSGGSVEG